MSILDFNTLEGKPFKDIVKALQEQGYELVGFDKNTDTAILALPGDDKAVLVSRATGQAEAFAKLSIDQQDNGFFPRFYEARRFEDASPVFVTVMEKLVTVAEMPQNQFTVRAGGARALTTILDGHHEHDVVHDLLMKNPEVVQAVFAIVKAMEDHLGSGGDTYIYYDSGFASWHDENERKPANEREPLEKWYPVNILFRPSEDGKSYKMVFGDPFREAKLRDETHRAEIRIALKELRARLNEMATPIISKQRAPAPSPSA